MRRLPTTPQKPGNLNFNSGEEGESTLQSELQTKADKQNLMACNVGLRAQEVSP